jgi:hypothetical protein
LIATIAQVRHGGYATEDVAWREDVGDDEVVVYDVPTDRDPDISIMEVRSA